LPAVPPINAEVLVGCEQDGISRNLRHPHETGISQVHGHVCIPAEQGKHGVEMFTEGEICDDRTATEQLREGRSVSTQQMKRF
jgi:hypothetical protein